MSGSTDFQAVRDRLVGRLAARLGIAAGEVDPRQSFSSYGLDSAGATGLMAELSADLGRDLSPTLVWAYPTPDELARHLTRRGTAGPSAARASGTGARRGRASREPIAIVGMACRMPGADSPRDFWRRLLEGYDAIRTVPGDRWDADAYYDPDPQTPGRINTRRGAFLDRLDQFDPLFFGISPREAAEMDPQQRLALELTWEALEDAGIAPRSLAGTRAGVFLGVIWRDYGDLHRDARAVATTYTGVGQALNIVANRVSYALGLRGPSLVMDTACSSSLVSVHLACQSLWDGESTVALAGGINLIFSAEIMVAVSKWGGLSGDGRCKAFDASANGFVRGEGAGLVVLKPLSRALADGDPVYCVIRGSAVNNDGASNGLTAPNPQAQEEVLTDAYERAGVDPGRVGYIEAHGTGTPLGDPIEARALSAVLCDGRPADRPLLLGSVKTNVGHLEGAAGIAGLIKLALTIHHRTLPPSLHFVNPNPHIPFEELRLRVVTAATPWPEWGGLPVGGVSSFGWGGTNAHLVVEGVPLFSPLTEPRTGLNFSSPGFQPRAGGADDPPAMAGAPNPSAAGGNPSAAGGNPSAAGGNPSAAGGNPSPAGGNPSPAGGMTPVHPAARVPATVPPPGVETPGYWSSAPPGRGVMNPPKLAFLFGPFGSQWPGMGRDLLREPAFRAAVERCDRAMTPLLGWSVLEEIALGAEGRMGDTPVPGEVAQPLFFTVQVALGALWRSWGFEPEHIAGHSLGEMPAAYHSGALSLEDAALVVIEYSRAQGRAAREHGMRGGMALANLSPEALAPRLAPYADRVVVSGYNGPVSTTVSGDPDALDALVAGLKAEGVFAARVELDAAVHSPQMEPVLESFRQALAGLRPRRPRIPLVVTVTGAPVEEPMDGAYWARNLRQPARFTEALEWLLDRGFELLVLPDPHPAITFPVQQTVAARGPEAPGSGARLLPSLKRGEAAGAVLGASLEALAAAGRPAAEASGRAEPFPLSARTPDALRDLSAATAARCREVGEPEAGGIAGIRDLAYTAALRRTHHEHRLCLAARSLPELADRLDAFARGEAVAGAASGRRARNDTPRLVFAFSGQGPQWPGMGRELFAGEPVFREAVERCDELLREHLGYSVWARFAEEGALDHTEVAQAALFVLQVGLVELWRSWGVEPGAVVGHSVGEVAAAWAAGVFSLAEAARIVALRGRTMEPAKGLGRMAAVELPAAEVQAGLAGYADRVGIAAMNSPAATVLSGEPEALEAVLARLRERGATCRPLRVEYAFHSPQMEPYDRDLEQALADLRPAAARVPMASTVLGGLVTGPELDAGYWRRNVREPVRFGAAVAALAREGYTAFLEVGPHPVLAVAVTQTLEAEGRPLEEVVTLASLRRQRDERETMLEAAGGLYTLGHPLDWRGFFPDGGRVASLPTYPFQRQRYWFEPGAAPSPALPVLAGPAPGAVPVPAPVAVPANGGAEPVYYGGDVLSVDLADPGVERILAAQIDSFTRLTTLQLDLLGGGAAGLPRDDE